LNLRYTPKALAELADILAYIAELATRRAQRSSAHTGDHCSFAQYPLSGQLASKAACAGS